MGFLSVIRRWALRDKMPVREIARRTGLSRNTISKYLREGASEPKFKTPARAGPVDRLTQYKSDRSKFKSTLLGFLAIASSAVRRAASRSPNASWMRIIMAHACVS